MPLFVITCTDQEGTVEKRLAVRPQHLARLEKLDAEGRVIIAAVASNLVRIQQVFDSAADYGRRVVLTGFNAENIVRTDIRMKRLRLVDDKLIVKPKDMHKYEDHELIILEAGRMGEPINGLHKMALGLIAVILSRYFL